MARRKTVRGESRREVGTLDMAAYSSTSMSLRNNDDEDDSGLPCLVWTGVSRFAVCEES
jgi:phosphate-selective porin